MRSLKELEIVNSITVYVFNINGALIEVSKDEVEAFGVEEIIRILKLSCATVVDDAWDYEKDVE